MSPFLATLVSGLLATAVMTTFMYFIHWSKLANGDMIRALGSFITKNLSDALPLGAVIHFIFGTIFAFIYLWIFRAFGFESTRTFITAGFFVGLVQGFIVSFWMIILVKEHHPLEQFRRVGFPVALLHIVAHVVYGVALGFFLQTFLPDVPT